MQSSFTIRGTTSSGKFLTVKHYNDEEDICLSILKDNEITDLYVNYDELRNIMNAIFELIKRK